MAITNLKDYKNIEEAFMDYCERFPDRVFNSPFTPNPLIDSGKWTGRIPKNSWDRGFVSFITPWFSISIGRFMTYSDRHIRIGITLGNRVYKRKEIFYWQAYGKNISNYFEFIIWKDKMSQLIDFKVRVIHQTHLPGLFNYS